MFPGVFAPQIFEDTYFFAENLPIGRGESLLEVGAGAGLIAIHAALNGAQYVRCTDINPLAVENILFNARYHGVSDRVRAELCDVFPSGDQWARSDVVFWNTPFIFRSEPITNILARSVYDFGYRGLEKYITGVRTHLAHEGRVYIGFSPTTGDEDRLSELLSENGFRKVLEAEDTFEDGFCLQLLELIPT